MGDTMTEVAAGLGALAEAVSFLSYFNNLEDLRQRGEVMYPLAWMLLLALIAVLAGGAGRGDRHRRQEPAADVSQERRERPDPCGFRLRRASAPGARSVKVSEKSNEITAIPKLLDMLAIKGAIVTIDA